MKTLSISNLGKYTTRILGISLVVLSAFVVNVYPQSRKPVHKPKVKNVVRPVSNETNQTSNEKVVNISAVSKEIQPVAVVNAPLPDFLSGEANVMVNPKQPTVVRLGLAQNAVSIVEFPASDGIYYIHEGNPKLASVFQSPTKETD